MHTHNLKNAFQIPTLTMATLQLFDNDYYYFSFHLQFFQKSSSVRFKTSLFIFNNLKLLWHLNFYYSLVLHLVNRTSTERK